MSVMKAFDVLSYLFISEIYNYGIDISADH